MHFLGNELQNKRREKRKCVCGWGILSMCVWIALNLCVHTQTVYFCMSAYGCQLLCTVVVWSWDAHTQTQPHTHLYISVLLQRRWSIMCQVWPVCACVVVPFSWWQLYNNVHTFSHGFMLVLHVWYIKACHKAELLDYVIACKCVHERECVCVCVHDRGNWVGVGGRQRE